MKPREGFEPSTSSLPRTRYTPKPPRRKQTGPEGFEPSTSGLEAQRYILAKPRAQRGNPRCFVYLKTFVNLGWHLLSLKIKNIPAHPRGNRAAVSVKVYTPSLFLKELPEMGKLKIFLECIEMHETFWFQY